MVSFSEPSTASEAGQNYMDVILAIRKDTEIGCRVPVASLAVRREQRFLLRAAKETINLRQADFTHRFTFISQGTTQINSAMVCCKF